MKPCLDTDLSIAIEILERGATTVDVLPLHVRLTRIGDGYYKLERLRPEERLPEEPG